MFVLFTLIYSFVVIVSSSNHECYNDGNDFCVNVNDILSVDLLPGTFLLAEKSEGKSSEVTTVKENDVINGTYEEAFNEMNYHRKRMNEYLCHGFMAEEIFQEIKSTRIKRRHQEETTMNSIPDFLADDNITVHDKLLSDEGSTKYKEWLQRTTTLDDIHRHFSPKRKVKKKIGSKIFGGIKEFDGEVTGFAMPAHVLPDKSSLYYDYEEDLITSPTGHYSHSAPSDYHSHSQSQSHHYSPPQHDDIVPVIHEEHHYHVPHHDEEEYWHKSQNYKGKGDLSIKDFFEVALTALAFLAFGLFVIQLLMAMTTPMTVAPTTVAADSTRYKRETFQSPYKSNAELNELSHRILQSIEAAMIAPYDSGQCLKWTLCKDNHHSTQTISAQRIWLPMWSVGMSWLSGRLVKQSTWTAMFDSLKASILGLGGGNCSKLYPKCDLVHERMKRRRRRRRK